MEKFLNSMLMENQEVIEQPIVLPALMDKLTQFSVNFIKIQGVNGSSPFALYHAFTSVHTPLSPARRFRGKSSHGLYGDRLYSLFLKCRYSNLQSVYFYFPSIIEMDEAVGQIMKALEEAQVDENTLVYFTSDHGADINLGALSGSNQLYKGGEESRE